MRQPEEIAALRREAEEQLAAAGKVRKLSTSAEDKVATLKAAVRAFAEHRAVELGVEANQLTLHQVLVTDDERALVRLLAASSVEAGSTPGVSPKETLDHVVARLAFERGWGIVDATRAVLGSAGATVDDLRDKPPHAKARRVRDAMKTAIRAQIENLDLQLAALDGDGPVTDAAPAIVVAAVRSFFAGREVIIEDVRRELRELREQKARLLGGLDRRSSR